MRLVPLAMLACAAFASACAVAPKSGPDASAVRAVESAGPYIMRPLDVGTVTALEVAGAAAEAAAAAAEKLEAARPLHGQAIRAGDLVQITIWEAVNGGLFSAAGESGPRSIALPPQRVDGAGFIDAPYAGRLRAAGRTPAQLSDALVRALDGKAIQPQAIAAVLESPGAHVTVIGDAAARPGRVPLAGVGERLLDVVAAAGGVKTPAHDAMLRLTRAGRSAAARYDRVLREPTQNVAVRPGDTVALTAEPRSYAVFGAALRPVLTPFPRARVTLAEAISAAGGLDDQRAEPESVFLFRDEPAAPALGLGEGPRQVVYNLDLTRPEAFFLARRFEMRDDDVIYVANAPITDLQKVLSAVGAALSPATRTVGLAGGL
ncbi:polysaccharide biosynthesis/export family protein [Rhodovulum sp. DZ06]|uniref:polysaccharide biosynthesis/export family protein n=1 Tax=Rhodovulum sp. DZ06 TaxID=3425126 RepID=UPI003D336754